MTVKTELLKLQKNPTIILIVLILLLSLGYQLASAQSSLENPNKYVLEAVSERRELRVEEFEKVTYYLKKIEENPTQIDMEYYSYCSRYAKQYLTFSSFASFVDSLSEANDRTPEEINAYKERRNELRYFRSYQSSGIKNMIEGRLWLDLLYLSPFLFASVYTFDKRYVKSILAGMVNSGPPLLKAKLVSVLLISTITYLLQITLLYLFYFTNSNVLSEFSLPYYYISPTTSWDLTIGQGLLWLTVVGFIQFLNLSIVLTYISQSCRTSTGALLGGLTYTLGSVFFLRYLRPYYNDSLLAKIILMIWGVTPAGGLSPTVQHDSFMTKNILGLYFLTDYNMPLVISALLSVLLCYLLYKRSRKCFRETTLDAKNKLFDVINVCEKLMS